LADTTGKIDVALVGRCNRGDEYAWEELYRRCLPLMHIAVKRFVPRTDNEDIIQDVFIQIFKALKQYDPTRSLEAYIMEIARRVAIGYLRRASASKRGGLKLAGLVNAQDEKRDQGFISLVGDMENQEKKLINAEEREHLRKAFKTLSDACKKLLELRYDAELSYQEISGILEIKEATLRVQAARCLSALARRYTCPGLSEVPNG